MSKIATFDISRFDDEKIEDLFTESFRTVSDKYENKLTISEFETKVVRTVGSRALGVEVRVYGLADVTSRHQIHNKKTGHAASPLKSVTVNVPNKGQAKFILESSADLNTNDYVLFYKLVAA